MARNTVQMSFVVSKDERARLEQLASSRGVSMNQLFREWLRTLPGGK